MTTRRRIADKKDCNKKRFTLRVAFVHDWLVTYRGGEKVLEALLELYPEAPVYTLFYQADRMPTSIRSRRIVVHRMLNLFRPLRKALLPFLPRAIESFDLSSFDLIISTSSCVAKGAVPGPHGKHLCYLHSPMRYIWDQKDEYIKGVRHWPFSAMIINYLAARLQRWDVASAKRVDRFVVNSNFVGERTKTFYQRDSVTIAPPVAIDSFRSEPKAKEDYYLVAGAMVSYKRADLAVEACRRADIPLVVAGAGPMETSLRQQAGPRTRFVIQPEEKEWKDLLAGAKGLLFPGVEDFGMVPIEAIAAGTPVLALRKGGALDYVIPGVNGEFFNEPTSESLLGGIRHIETKTYNPSEMFASVEKFGREHFLRHMRKEIDLLVNETT